MRKPTEYAPAFRAAYATLHGGLPDQPAADTGRRADESLEEFLARSRSEALGRLRRRLEATEPPHELRAAHELLLRLLDSAIEADAALYAQMEAYRCGDFQESIARSDRLQNLIAHSARLDRDLILALREAERAAPGTLAVLGIAEVGEPPVGTEGAEEGSGRGGGSA